MPRALFQEIGRKRNRQADLSLLDRGRVAASNHAPDEQYDYCSDNCAYEPGSLISTVPTQGLPNEGCQECTRDAKNGRQDEA
jgi:hypothetical protein